MQTKNGRRPNLLPDHLATGKVDPIVRANAEGLAYGGPIADRFGLTRSAPYYGDRDFLPMVYDARVLPSLRCHPETLVELFADAVAERNARFRPRVSAFVSDHGQQPVVEEVTVYTEDYELERRFREEGVAGVTFDDLQARAEAAGLAPMDSLKPTGRRLNFRCEPGEDGYETELSPARIAEILAAKTVRPPYPLR